MTRDVGNIMKMKNVLLLWMIFLFSSRLFAVPCDLHLIKDGEVIKSDVTKFILTETQEGRDILKAITSGTDESIQITSAAESVYAYRKFLILAAKNENGALDSLIDELRAVSHAISRNDKTSQLTSRQKDQLVDFAANNLKINSISGKSNIQFADSSKDVVEIFPYDDFNPLDSDGKFVSGPEFHKRAGNFFKDMRQCLKNMPKKEKVKKIGTIISQQVGISLGFSLWGYTSGAIVRGDKVDWANMPTDLSVAAISAAVDPILAVSTTGIIGNYLKMLGWTLAKSELEIALYNFSPLTDTHGFDKNYIGLERFKYSADWGALSAAAKLALFNTLLGLSCMYPTNTMAIINTGIQFAYRGASSSGYFLLRNQRFESRGILTPSKESEEIEESE